MAAFARLAVRFLDRLVFAVRGYWRGPCHRPRGIRKRMDQHRLHAERIGDQNSVLTAGVPPKQLSA